MARRIATSTRAAVLTGLGFTIADELPRDELYVEVNREQIELFEQDLLLWELGDLESRDTIESDPLYQRLDAVHEVATSSPTPTWPAPWR